MYALHAEVRLGDAFLHRMEFRRQIKQVHLRNVRVVLVERLLELFVGLVHTLLRVVCKFLHFTGEQVVVVVRLQFHILLVDFLLDGERFLL